MRELLDLCVEGADYMVQTHRADDAEAAKIQNNLWEAAGLLAAEFRGEGLLRQMHLYAQNIQASIDDLRTHPEQYERIVSMEIRPFVMELRRLWELDTVILQTEDSRAAYHAAIMEQAADLHGAPSKDAPYDVTILLLAYNKLDYTKCAVESILRHTDFSKGNIELILLNNGSDDGTREYFEGLPFPYKRVMNLRHNILGTFAYTHIIKGRYYVGFANDVVATPHWLEHLLACIASDERIAWAVPVCNEESISNNQGIPVPYPNTFDGMSEMQSFAAVHNQMNPALWEEWAVLMPFLAIMRSDVFQVGLVDPIYTRAEFVDDDLSTLLRRTGWRQLLLKDTFMHHFGGVTLGADRYSSENNAIVEMRRVYYGKWGVDAWASRGGFVGVENAWRWHTFRANERVLILEPRFGHLACDLFNVYRRNGFTPHMTAAVFDERYLPDTGYLFDETAAAQHIGDIPMQGQYDIISAGCYLDELPLNDVIADLERLYGFLAPGGMLLLPVRNPSSAHELTYIMDAGGRDIYCGSNEVKPWRSIPYRPLLRAIDGHPYLHRYKAHSMVYAEDELMIERIKPLLRVGGGAPADLEMSILVQMFFLGIFKESE